MAENSLIEAKNWIWGPNVVKEDSDYRKNHVFSGKKCYFGAEKPHSGAAALRRGGKPPFWGRVRRRGGGAGRPHFEAGNLHFGAEPLHFEAEPPLFRRRAFRFRPSAGGKSAILG